MAFGWDKLVPEENPHGFHYRLFWKENGSLKFSVNVYPELGFKLAGMFWNGLYYGFGEPKWGKLLQTIRPFGSPILYPTPNRVRNHTFTFQGKTCEMIKDGKPCGLHGLAFDGDWKYGEPEIQKDCIVFQGILNTREGDVAYQAFPFSNRLTVQYQLYWDYVKFWYQVENTGWEDMPYGVGLHSGFVRKNQDEAVYLSIPTEFVYETIEGLIPTGRLLPIQEGGPECVWHRDIRELNLDTGFLLDGGNTFIQYSERKTQIRIVTSSDMTVAVIFTPADSQKNPEPLFFVEHQTCCTDAINQYDQGKQYTGLQILPPGEKHFGFISYYFEEMAL